LKSIFGRNRFSVGPQCKKYGKQGYCTVFPQSTYINSVWRLPNY
jgi:hypothetical protein